MHSTFISPPPPFLIWPNIEFSCFIPTWSIIVELLKSLEEHNSQIDSLDQEYGKKKDLLADLSDQLVSLLSESDDQLANQKEKDAKYLECLVLKRSHRQEEVVLWWPYPLRKKFNQASGVTVRVFLQWG